MHLSRPAGGTTLVEIIVAFAILIPLITVVVGIFPYASHITHRAGELATANDLATQALEQARAAMATAIPTSSTQKIDLNGINYSVVVTVQPFYPGSQPPPLYKVSTVVQWQTQQSYRIELDSILTRLNH
jgi:type II secretory pathway pseudopilin PulG